MTCQSKDFVACGPVPELDGCVVAAAGQRRAIWRKCQAIDRAGVAAQGVGERLPAACVAHFGKLSPSPGRGGVVDILLYDGAVQGELY